MIRMMILLGFTLTFGGCVAAPANTASTPDKYVANFNYSVPAQATIQDNAAVFIVGKVAYKHAGKTPWLSRPQFENLDKAIDADLPEILAAKGFSIRGPYDTYDLIPYGDKKVTDFYMHPVVTAMVMKPDTLYVSDMHSSPGPVAKVIVKIDLELREIVTRELMWSKSLNITELDVSIVSVLQSYTEEHGKITQLVFRPEGLENLMAKEVERQYPTVMDTIYKLIDLEEMSIIKEQAQEVKSKNGY